MSEITDIIINYWKSFCQTLPVNEKDSCLSYKIDAWAFGDSSKMADDLLKYVISGEKTDLEEDIAIITNLQLYN